MLMIDSITHSETKVGNVPGSCISFLADTLFVSLNWRFHIYVRFCYSRDPSTHGSLWRHTMTPMLYKLPSTDEDYPGEYFKSRLPALKTQ